MLDVSRWLLHEGRRRDDTNDMQRVPGRLGVRRHERHRGVRGGDILGGARRVRLHSVRSRIDIERGRDAVRVLPSGHVPFGRRRVLGVRIGPSLQLEQGGELLGVSRRLRHLRRHDRDTDRL